MYSPGQGRGHKRIVEGRRREEIEDGCVGYYALVVADSIACCFAELHEQLTSDERAWEVPPVASRRPSSLFKRKRKSSVPVSRFNPSVIYEQPTRPGELRKPPKLAGKIYPTSEVMQRQSRPAKREAPPRPQRKSRNLEDEYQEPQPIKISLANQYPRPLPPPPDVMSNPNALINRPKSAYTRNRRMDDEEPVFWQHSNRSTMRLLRQSETPSLRPKSLTISKRQQEEVRRSNGSAFENFVNRTFASQPSLNLKHIQPNPIINIHPPSTPSLPATPVEGDQASQQRQLPSQPEIKLPSPREIMTRSRLSDFQEQPSEKRFSGSSAQDEKRFSGSSREQKRFSLSSRDQKRFSALSLDPKRFSGLSQDQSSFSTLEEPPTNEKRFSGSSQETPKSKRYSGFRPLQLSFYLPGNRLSLLPQFSDDDDNDAISDIPPMPEVPRPASALMKAKPSVISDRTSTIHTIPRKAVGSQTTSVAGGSARSSVQSSVTLNNTLYSRSSLLQDPPRSDGRLSTSIWRNTADFQTSASKSLPSPARPVSRILSDAVQILNSKRKSTHSIYLETEFPENSQPQQGRDECPPISEESSPAISPVSPISPLSPDSPAPIKHHSAAVTFHDYEFASATPQVPKHHSAVEYHEYDFTTPTPTTPAFSTATSQPRDSTMKVSPLFHHKSSQPPKPTVESKSVSDDEDENDEPQNSNSKPRSSSGSSTLYHGDSSSPDEEDESEAEISLAVKHTLSIALPSPINQHRLSAWLSKSGQVQSWAAPQKGEVYSGGPDSPTLGFSWKDFGWDGGEKGDEKKKRPYTIGGEKFVEGEEEDFDLERFPVPGGVGVAY